MWGSIEQLLEGWREVWAGGVEWAWCPPVKSAGKVGRIGSQVRVLSLFLLAFFSVGVGVGVASGSMELRKVMESNLKWGKGMLQTQMRPFWVTTPDRPEEMVRLRSR